MKDELGFWVGSRRSAVIVWPKSSSSEQSGGFYIISGEYPQIVADRIRRLIHEVGCTGIADSDELMALRAHFEALRRQVARVQREHADANDGERDEKFIASLFDEIETLEESLAQAKAGKARERARADALTARVAQMQRSSVAVSSTQDDDAEPDPHEMFRRLKDAVSRTPNSILEALEIADALCPALVFAESARDDAKRSQYENPARMLDDLLKLGVVATLYARPEGAGAPPQVIARDLGLDWIDNAPAAHRGNTARHYRFRHEDQEHVMEPHLRVGGASTGLTRIGRVYFCYDEAPDGARRLLVGGMVKRPDTTT
jgi:hypothetical protein